MDRLSDVLRSAQAKVDAGVYVQIPHWLYRRASDGVVLTLREAQEALAQEGTVRVCALGAIYMELGKGRVRVQRDFPVLSYSLAEELVRRNNEYASGTQGALRATFADLADWVQEHEEALERQQRVGLGTMP